jgi:hypothetical protein
MKVVRNTPEQLIIEETPWLLGIMFIFFILAFVGPGLFLVTQGELIGLLFAGLGGGLGTMALVLFVQRIQVILDGTTDEVIVRRRSIVRYTEEIHRLSELAEAQVDMTRSSKGTLMKRPVLIFDRGMSVGPQPIVSSYTSGFGPQRAVSAINGWLQATRGMDAGRRDTGG